MGGGDSELIAAVPIIALNAIRDWPCVRRIRFEDADYKVRSFVEAHIHEIAIDTTGDEPVVGVYITTTGDFHELDSMGINTTVTHDSVVTTSIPIKDYRRIRALKTVHSICFSYWLHLNSASSAGMTALGPIGHLSGRVLIPGVESGLLRQRADTGLSDPEPPRPIGIDSGEFINEPYVPMGLYDCEFVVDQDRMLAANPGLQPCSTIVVRGVRVLQDRTTVINLDTALLNQAQCTDGVCSVEWTPEYN